MSKKIKIVLGLFILLTIVVFGASFYLVKKNLDPAKMREKVTEVLKEKFPNTESEIGAINLKLGTSIKLEVEKFKLTTNKKESLFDVNDFLIKIPIWAILTGGGDINFYFNSPKLSYLEGKSQTNWGYALENTSESKGDVNSSKTEEKKVVEDQKVELPSFLEKSALNLEFKDLNLDYKLKDKSKGSLNVSKFIIKELSLKGPAAIEMDSTVLSKDQSGNELSFSALWIGQANIGHFLTEGELDADTHLKIKNIQKPDMGLDIPDIDTKLKVHLKKDGVITGNFETSFLDANNIKSNLYIKDGAVKLNDLIGNLSVLDLFNIMKIKNSGINPNRKNFIKLKGGVDLKKNGELLSNLNMQVTPELPFSIDGLSGTILGSLITKGNKIRLDLKTKVLGGEGTISFDSPINLNSSTFSMKDISPYSATIKLENLKLKKDFIQKLTAVEEVENSPEKPSETNKNVNKNTYEQVKLPRGKVNLSVRNILIQNSPLNIKGNVKTSYNTFELENFKFNYAKGIGAINSKTKFLKKSDVSNFSANLNNLSLEGLVPFLPKSIKETRGSFSGKVDGVYSRDAKGNKYKANVKIQAINGELKGINIKDRIGKIEKVLRKIPKVKDKIKDKNFSSFDSSFDLFSLNGVFKNTRYDISAYEFYTKKNNTRLKGKGTVYPDNPNEISELYIDFIEEGRLGESLSKSIGSNTIPILLKGKGTDLSPVYDFTLSRIGKKAAKTQGKKVIKKQINKLKDKIFKDDKIKNIFKKIF